MKIWLATLLFAGSLSTLRAEFPVEVRANQEEFTLIVVPDTQRYAMYFPEIFFAQTRWIRDHHAGINAKYVIHLGDIVDEMTEKEWHVADRAFAELDGVIPYLVVPGNHDLDRNAEGEVIRGSTRYNGVFSPYRFKGRPWYGGHKGVTNDNNFGYFAAAGRKFLIVGLEFGPTDETLQWADGLIGNHENDYRVILATHAYMYHDDTRLGEGDSYSPHSKGPGWNDGEEIWEKLVRKQENLFLVLSGHVKGDGAGLLVSESDSGFPVIQMLANYQFLEHGGQGWLRILKFLPRENRMEVYTYSPWLDAFREEPDQRFDLPLPGVFAD